MKINGKSLVEAGMTFCGLILMVTPLAIWASPTKTSFYYVLAFAATAMFGVLTLAQYEEPGSPPPRHSKPKPLVRLPEQFHDIVQDLQPLVHHHRRRGGSKFRHGMERAKRLLRRRD